MMIPRFAFRNVLRQKRRSLVVGFSTAFTVGVMIIYGALLDGFFVKMSSGITKNSVGNFQIESPEYQDDPSLFSSIAHGQDIVEKLEQQGITVSGRLIGTSLVATTVDSMGALIYGVSALREKKVSDIYKGLAEGQWLDSESQQVVVGRLLARNLNLNIGDEIVLLGQSADGAMANDIYRVGGILKSIDGAIDRSGIFMNEQQFREFFVMPSGFHRLVVGGASLIDKESLEKLRTRINENALGQRVRSWREIMPTMADMVDLSRYSMTIMILLIYFALGLIVVNATIMGVIERTREFGIIKAIGVRPFQILQLVVCESLILNGLAALFGVIFGLPLAIYLQIYGIDLSVVTDSLQFNGLAMEPTWHSQVTFKSVWQPVVYLIVVMALASLYPALKAARMKAATAMRTI
jgi:putative ABC transport system permease protein